MFFKKAGFRGFDPKILLNLITLAEVMYPHVITEIFFCTGS